jgi:hypothetical protein
MNERSPSTGSPLRRELARRSFDGLDVTLLWTPKRREDGADELVVCVCDTRAGAYFEIPTDPHRALDVYYHPFAHTDFSTVGYQNDRLAA